MQEAACAHVAACNVKSSSTTQSGRSNAMGRSDSASASCASAPWSSTPLRGERTSILQRCERPFLPRGVIGPRLMAEIEHVASDGPGFGWVYDACCFGGHGRRARDKRARKWSSKTHFPGSTRSQQLASRFVLLTVRACGGGASARQADPWLPICRRARRRCWRFVAAS